jgi:hypothetical protein
MEAHQRVEFTGGSGLMALVGSGPASGAARRDKEATPARLGEGARSAVEPLVSGLPRWSAHNWGRQRHCAAVSKGRSGLRIVARSC